MITEEQLKNLKKGDKVLAEVEIDRVDYSTVSGIVPVYMDGTERRKGVVFFNSSLIHLMPTPPKYDPCRRFKKGDIVRVVEWNGRAPIYLKKHIGEIQVVTSDEDSNGVAGIKGDIEFAYVTYLELVTPAEERMPYSVETDQHGFHIERYDGKVLATYNDEIHPNAYEAAVAEYKRLNEAWRKEHESNL